MASSLRRPAARAKSSPATLEQVINRTKTDGGHHDGQTVANPEIIKKEIGERTDCGSPASFNFGKILFGATRERGEFRAGLFDGYAGFESSEQKQRTIFAGVRGLIGCGHFEGRPQLWDKSGQMEARRMTPMTV
jgi:hypothetical protein